MKRPTEIEGRRVLHCWEFSDAERSAFAPGERFPRFCAIAERRGSGAIPVGAWFSNNGIDWEPDVFQSLVAIWAFYTGKPEMPGEEEEIADPIVSRYKNPDPRCTFPFSADNREYCIPYAVWVDVGKSPPNCADCTFWNPLEAQK